MQWIDDTEKEREREFLRLGPGQFGKEASAREEESMLVF